MSFHEKLGQAQKQNDSLLCIGLDPDHEKIPRHLHNSTNILFDFCAEIVETTKDIACVYKPNLAFFEAYGADGIRQLEQLMAVIPQDIPVILDGKRGDIGNSSRMYAKFLFEHLGGDAATVSPYLGTDSLTPFLEHAGRGIFVLCVTSNPGAADLQFGEGQSPALYERVIAICKKLNTEGEVGLVTGATHVEQLRAIRAAYPDGPLLVPGLGIQGGDLPSAVNAATAGGTRSAVFNASRGIIYAGAGEDFAQRARAKALEYRAAINEALTK